MMIDWPDASYIRVFTNDPPWIMALSWQARGLYFCVLRKLSPSGALNVGDLGLRGVAAVMCASWADVEKPIRELVECGCLRFDERAGIVSATEWHEMQATPRSDAARKRDSRRGMNKPRTASPGNVYVVRSSGTGWIKIGWSSSWEDRVRGLSTQHGAPLDVMLVIPGTQEDERLAHERFALDRKHGEWFVASEYISEWVAEYSRYDVRSVTVKP